MRRLGWGGVAVAGWLVLGLVGMWVTPVDAPSPGQSQILFGSSPSMQSSAPSGLLAFVRLLERGGFEVGAHLAPQPPNHAVWVLLEPNVILSDEEVTSASEWLHAGGRLIYAPKRIEVKVRAAHSEPPGAGDDPSGEGGDTDIDESQGETVVTLDDPLLVKLSDAGKLGQTVGSSKVWQVGAGRVAVLDPGAGVLSNQALSAHGLSGELAWLNPILAGRRRVVFDEARLGTAAEVSALGLLRESRFGPALNLMLVTLLVWLVARGARRQPARAEPPAGGRVFGEHLDAVGAVLGQGGRVRLAGNSLLTGTRRRLGALAAAEEATAALASAQSEMRAGLLVRGSERLRRLEARLRARDT